MNILRIIICWFWSWRLILFEVERHTGPSQVSQDYFILMVIVLMMNILPIIMCWFWSWKMIPFEVEKKILRHKCREITSFWLPGHVALWKEIFRLDQTDGDWSILSFLVSQFRFGHCDYFIVRYFQRHVSINSDLSQALISRSNRPKSRNRVAKNYPKMIDRPLRVSYYHES